MSFNGTGTFNRIYSWVTDQANGILVRADRMDTDTNDIATGLSNCMTRDGQSPPTAPIPMGAQKLTGLANGSAPQDATTVLQVFTSPTFATPTLTSPTITGTITATGVTGALNLSNAASVAVPTATVGDNTTKAASTAFVQTTAFNAALPAQAGNSGKIVTTNGSVASWSLIGGAGQFLQVNQAGTALVGGAAPGSSLYLAQFSAV